MLITCPHCNFSKEIDPAKLSKTATKVKCPKCKQGFALQQEPEQKQEQTPEPVAQPTPVVEPEIKAPPTQEPEPRAVQPDANRNNATLATPVNNIFGTPKAGFWIRAVAALVDGFVLFIIQFILGFALTMAGLAAIGGSDAGIVMTVLVQLFGIIINFVYYVLFTGSCGQTPGKMALRIKVVNCDGSQLSYGRAAIREIPAKFISGIILGIGYLMVAFDDQKQGLHDRMAKTYVIKL